MAQQHDNAFVAFVHERSRATRDALLAEPLAPGRLVEFERMTIASLEEQKRIEATDTLPFELYREQYVSPERLGLKSRRSEGHARRAAPQRTA